MHVESLLKVFDHGLNIWSSKWTGGDYRLRIRLELQFAGLTQNSFISLGMQLVAKPLQILTCKYSITKVTDVHNIMRTLKTVEINSETEKQSVPKVQLLPTKLPTLQNEHWIENASHDIALLLLPFSF